MINKFCFLIVFVIVGFSSSTNFAFPVEDDFGGYGSWDEYCKGEYGSEYYYDAEQNVCDVSGEDFGGYGSWDEYCKGEYGSEYYYDAEQNVCDVSG